MASRTAVTVSVIQPAASAPVRVTMTGGASSPDGGQGWAGRARISTPTRS
jgi:hypothetical protein